MRLLVLHNKNAAFHLFQSTYGLSAAHLLLFFSVCAQSHNRFPSQKHLWQGFCFAPQACLSVSLVLGNRCLCNLSWFFPAPHGNNAALRAHFKHSLSLFRTLITAFLFFSFWGRSKWRATFMYTTIILPRTHPDPLADQASISPFIVSTKLSNSIFIWA